MIKHTRLTVFIESFISEKNEIYDYPFSREDWLEFISVAKEIPFNSSDDWGIVKFKDVELIDSPPERIIIAQALDKTIADKHFTKFTFEIQPHKNLVEHHFWGYAHEIARKIQQLLVAATIAKPDGHFGSNHIVAIWNERVIWTRRGHGNLEEYISYGKQICDWPQYNRISIRDSWAWTNNRSGFLNKRSNNKVSRALSCFTQLFTEFSLHEDCLFLLWSMIGLEALTNSGPSGMQSSFYSRICTMIGEPKKSKEKFKELYRERSKLIHGQYDLAGQFAEFSEDPDLPTFPDELYDAQSLAIAIFVGVLQYCVINKIADIKFEITKSEIIDD
jgi:hypothetical protein